MQSLESETIYCLREWGGVTPKEEWNEDENDSTHGWFFFVSDIYSPFGTMKIEMFFDVF